MALSIKRQREEVNEPPAVEECEFEPVPVTKLRIDSQKHDPNCFGCIFKFALSDNPLMITLHDTYTSNRGKIHHNQLCILMSNVQRKLFIENFKHVVDWRDKTKPIPWSADQINAHLKHHMVQYDVDLENDYQDLKFLAKELYDNTLKKDTKMNKIVGNKEDIDNYTKVIKLKNEIRMLISKKQ